MGYGLLIGVVATLGLAGCTETEKADPTMVALLVADRSADRWSEVDEPAFISGLEADCPECEVVVRNADNDPKQQRSQLAAVLAAGADVVVLNAVSAESGEELVVQAGEVPVVAYDRFVPGADYAVAFDPAWAGQRLAKATLAELGDGPDLLVGDAPVTDPQGAMLRRAVAKTLRRAKITPVAEFRPEGPATDPVAGWVRRAWTPVVDGVLTSSDEQADAVAAALTARGVPESRWPVIAGRGADLDALRRLILGTQAVTVYGDHAEEAGAAAGLAAALIHHDPVEDTTELEGVPALLLHSTPITLENLTTVIVGSGRYTTRRLCRGETTERCTELGIR